jgi:hypothetical protein
MTKEQIKAKLAHELKQAEASFYRPRTALQTIIIGHDREFLRGAIAAMRHMMRMFED